jgi:hypothetical protein
MQDRQESLTTPVRTQRRPVQPGEPAVTRDPTRGSGRSVMGRKGRLSADQILGLQRSIGNAQVARLLSRQPEPLSPVHSVVGKGGGVPLPARSRQVMESSLGHDFSGVRVHRGPDADESTRSVGATAYTVGNEVVLGSGAPEIASRAGQHLLAHELVHVVQQRSGDVGGAPAPGGVRLSDPDDRFEQEAEAVAQRVASAPSSADPRDATDQPGIVGRARAEQHDFAVQGSAASPFPIQRFAVTDQPASLAAATIKVRYFGATDGAFRITEHGTGTQLWIKGTNEAPQRQEYAAKVMKLVDVQTPDIRTLDRPGAVPLFDQFKYLSLLGPSEEKDVAGIEGNKEALDDQIIKHSAKKSVVLLEHAPGVHAMGVNEMRKERKTDADKVARKFKKAFKSPEFAASVGRMMAADIFLGNFDRVGWVRTGGRGKGTSKAHGGNFVVDLQAKVLRAIDNDTNFESYDDIATLVSRNIHGLHGAYGYRGVAGMELLFADDKAEEALKGLIKTYSPLVSTGGEFQKDVGIDAFALNAMQGYHAAKATILASLDDLKSELLDMGEGDDSFAIEGLRARKSYAEIRQGGAGHEEALAGTEAYLKARKSDDGPYLPRLVAIGTNPVPKGVKFADEVAARSARIAQVADDLKADAVTYLRDKTKKETRLWVRRLVDQVPNSAALRAPLRPFVQQAQDYARRPFASSTRAELKTMEAQIDRLLRAFEQATTVVRRQRKEKA